MDRGVAATDRQGPTKSEIKAVQKVLYKHARLQQIFDDYSSIDALMHLDMNTVSVGVGPSWFVPATGKLDPTVTEAVKRCHRIAANQRAIAGELKTLKIDPGDRKTLVTAMTEQAASWDARGDAWGQNSAPSEHYIKSTVAKIKQHQANATAAAHEVRAYMKSTEDLTS